MVVQILAAVHVKEQGFAAARGHPERQLIQVAVIEVPVPGVGGAALVLLGDEIVQGCQEPLTMVEEVSR